MLAELRDANFAAEEQQERLTALEAAMAAATQHMLTAQQSNARLEKEVLLQSQQQQHLLDELSQSQVCHTVLCQGHAPTYMLTGHLQAVHFHIQAQSTQHDIWCTVLHTAYMLIRVYITNGTLMLPWACTLIKQTAQAPSSCI